MLPGAKLPLLDRDAPEASIFKESSPWRKIKKFLMSWKLKSFIDVQNDIKDSYSFFRTKGFKKVALFLWNCCALLFFLFGLFRLGRPLQQFFREIVEFSSNLKVFSKKFQFSSWTKYWSSLISQKFSASMKLPLVQ